MQAGNAFNKGRRAAEVYIIILFFQGEQFAQAPFFLLMFGEKIKVEAKAEALGKVGIRDGSVLMLQIDPGIIVPSLQGILPIIGILVDEGGGQGDDVWPQIDIIAVFPFKHPGGDVVGVGQIARGCKDKGIAGTGIDAIVATGVGKIVF